MPLFRVTLRGLGSTAPEGIAVRVGATLEASSVGVGGEFHVVFLIESDTREDAIEALRSLVARQGQIDGVSAELVAPPPGCGDADQEVEHDALRAIRDLTVVERAALASLLDDEEQTSLVIEVVQECVSEDRRTIEAALADLERRGLVWRDCRDSDRRAHGEVDPADWWALTDQAWTTLGLIKRPQYNGGRQPPARPTPSEL